MGESERTEREREREDTCDRFDPIVASARERDEPLATSLRTGCATDSHTMTGE